MKMQRCASIQLKVLIFVLFSSLLPSCRTSTWIVPSEYIGNWESEMNKITVRYKLNPNDNHSRFISDSAVIKLKINDDKTVRGFIGRSVIDSGKVLKSWSFPGLREVEYSIKCYTTGKIFEKDPLESKRVDIWLKLLNEHGKIKGDIRSGGSNFPMGLMIFEKVNK